MQMKKRIFSVLSLSLLSLGLFANSSSNNPVTQKFMEQYVRDYVRTQLKQSAIAGRGTDNAIPLWADTSSLSDSIISQPDTSHISIAGDILAAQFFLGASFIDNSPALAGTSTQSGSSLAVGIGALANVINRLSFLSRVTAIGAGAMSSLTTGGGNTAVGAEGLKALTTGSGNTAVGSLAMSNMIIGGSNCAIGRRLLQTNTSGNQNVAVGSTAMSIHASGSNHLALGSAALSNLTIGSNNIVIGTNAGQNYTSSSSDNILIGNSGSAPGETGYIRIGSNSSQSHTFIAGIYSAVIPSGVNVVIDSAGNMGTVVSSIRYKEDIHNMGHSTDKLMKLRPVSFRYIHAAEDGSKPLQYGLIAEEVEKVYPELVVYDNEGQIQGVQYHQLIPMLLNELKHQHAEIKLLKEQLAKLQTERQDN